MADKKTTGKLGEDLACDFLKQKGYRILQRNYWQPWGEIDIIAVAPEKALVFIEVKMLVGDVGENTGQELVPEDNLTAAKLQKLKKVCSGFANSHSELMRGDKGWRIDLVAITIDTNRADNAAISFVKDKDSFDIKHYENIGA